LLCLQETKVQDEQFPVDAIAEAGYKSSYHGQKTYNGVALLSKEPLEDVHCGFPGDPAPEQARVISAVLDGIRFVNVYVINGKALGTDKFELKMQRLHALTAWLKSFDLEQPLVVLGDFNIAPDERDVHDVEKWHGKIHFSDEEHAKLKALTDLGLSDLYRKFHTEAGLYSWWDYRGGAFPRDLGLRIDLGMGTESAAERCSGAVLDRDERKKGTWEAKPSDHVPLCLDFDTSSA